MLAAQSKLPDVGTTIFTVMSQLAGECGAINLSQGFPDFPAPAGLLDRVSHHLRAGNNQYAPMAGLPELRERIASKTEALYGRATDPDAEVTITSGATEALFSAIEAFVHPHDEVIVFDPAYDSYDPAIRLAGGRPIHIPMRSPDFEVDWDAVRTAVNPRTRMIVLNTPHNPTGAVLDRDDMQALTDIVRDTDILLLGDEVYEHIIFDGREHQSLLRSSELAERSLVVSSFGKTYHATGWKIGYCIAPPILMAEFRRVHQFVQFCVATPFQYALADFMDTDPSHYLELPRFYEQKRDRFCQLIGDSRFRFTPSSGTYFQLVDYSDISDGDDLEFSRWMTTEHGVACIPVSVFYASPPNQRLVRFCFAKDDSTLEEAAENSVQDLTLTIIQTELAWEDPAANRAHFDGLIAGIEEPTDLIVLPETFSTGFTMDAAANAETMDGDTVSWMRLVAKDFGTTLCGSLVIEEDGRYYNRLIWMPPDGNCGFYDKRHLFRMGGERENYSPGSGKSIFTIKDWRVLPLVCYDLRFPVWSRGIDEFELLLFVANWPKPRRSAWQVLLPARGVENLCYVAGVNRIGADGNDVVCAGDSIVSDYLGKEIVNCGDRDCAETVTLSGANLERYRKKFPAYLDADRFTIDT